MKIPIRLFDRIIGYDSGERPVLSRVYDKWSKIYAIKKVYYLRGNNTFGPKPCIVLETKKSLCHQLAS